MEDRNKIITEGYVKKGGINPNPKTTVAQRPPKPAPMKPTEHTPPNPQTPPTST